MKYIILFVMIFLYGGCSPRNKEITCCSLENEYKKYNDFKGKLYLNTIYGKSNKMVSKLVSLYNLERKFKKRVHIFLQNTLSSYKDGKRKLLFPNINKYCKSINSILSNETNKTIIENRFKKIESKWIEDYKRNLKLNLKGKFIFREFEGCIENSKNWRNSFLNFRANPSHKTEERFNMAKRGYEDCLRGSIKKYNILRKRKELKNAKY